MVNIRIGHKKIEDQKSLRAGSRGETSRSWPRAPVPSGSFCAFVLRICFQISVLKCRVNFK